jgi:hypothetical protein
VLAAAQRKKPYFILVVWFKEGIAKICILFPSWDMLFSTVKSGMENGMKAKN